MPTKELLTAGTYVAMDEDQQAPLSTDDGLALQVARLERRVEQLKSDCDRLHGELRELRREHARHTLILSQIRGLLEIEECLG